MGNPLYTDDFLKEVARRCDYSVKDTEEFYNQMRKLIEECILERTEIHLRGFLHLEYGKIKSSPHRFKAGEQAIQYPESERIRFRISTNLKRLLKKETLN